MSGSLDPNPPPHWSHIFNAQGLIDFSAEAEKSKLDPQEVRARTSILALIAEDVPLQKAGREWAGLCPFHADTDPSLNVNEATQVYICRSCGAKGDAFTWMEQRHGLNFADALQALAQRAGILDGAVLLPAVQLAPRDVLADKAAEEAAIARTAAEVQTSLTRCGPVAPDGLAARYLRSRGITQALQGSDLLEAADLTHYPSKAGWPALVGLVHDPVTGQPTGGIHRTWLALDGSGKAPVPKAKMMLGPSIGVVRLGRFAGGRLGVAEGIETALSAQQMSGIPVWAALTTTGMRQFRPPAGVSEVFIFADKGEAGQGAANDLAQALAGSGVAARIVLPDGPDDFNDDLQQGRSAIALDAPAGPLDPICDLTRNSATADIAAALRWVDSLGLDEMERHRKLREIKSRTGMALPLLQKELRRQSGGGGETGGVQQSGRGLQLPYAPWHKELILDPQGEVKPLLANAVTVLEKAQEWRGVLAFNAFANAIELQGPAPWQPLEGWRPQRWTGDHDIAALRWMQQIGVHITSERTIYQAVSSAAGQHPYHPVCDYLDALVWDEMPRLDAWTQICLGAEDTIYNRAVGARWMIGAVARAMEPGCKMDTTMILEGEQDLKKSTAFKVLGDPWFTDTFAEIGSKDAAQQCAGVWIIEMAELASLGRGEVSRIKNFLTSTIDRYRPPYGHHPIEQPRGCVFGGTVNPDGAGYLKDPTGGRRFWPIKCTRIDIDLLRKSKDQLWAEAAVRYRAGEIWWMDEPELKAAAKLEQAERLETDPWETPIQEYLAKQRSPAAGELYDRSTPLIDVSVSEILGEALGIKRGDWNRTHQMRVAGWLKANGWEKYRQRYGKDLEWRYRKAE